MKIHNDTLQSGSDCSALHPFICFDDHMVLVQEQKTFEEALIHCRTHHGEFATITNQHQQRMVQEPVNQAQTDYTWIGLAYACFFEQWMWVNGDWVSAQHQNWENPKVLHGCDVAGAMTKEEPSKWFKLSLGKRLNFVCTVGCSCRRRKHVRSCLGADALR
uniref:C-type lectin domain-containing protein n=1 Tax=Knipowitschia caucasica TaxID=637954 RepID=A0AAV2KCU1_KNICA